MELAAEKRSCVQLKIGKIQLPINTLDIILAVIYMYILVTNFSIPIINTSLLLFLFCFALFAQLEYSVALWAFLDIYFSYSYLVFDNYIGITAHQFIVLYLGLVVLRHLSSIVHIVLKRYVMTKFLLLLILPIFLMLQREYVGAVKVLVILLFCIIFSYCVFERKKVLKTYVLVLVFALFSTYIYNIVWIQIFHLNEAIRDLASGRYTGVRDANNFALWSNIALCLINYTECFKKKWTKKVVTILLCVGILATISISGICTMCFLLYFVGCKNHASTRFMKLLLVVPVVLILLVFFSMFANESGGILTTILGRFTTILNQLRKGDYSAATSSRTYLWGYYFAQWQELSNTAKTIGAYDVYAQLITTQLGSHNTYIDYMMTYGLPGLIAIIVSFFIPMYKKRDKHIWLLKIVYAVNIFARSMDPLGTALLFFML